jgi:hypothetical protein
MNTEDKTKLLNTLGYGLKYTLATAIAILAICATCFIYTIITTYFGPPLQPMFDQERLGQLGDFLGGTLNPIFGFATVCLLLWSVFIQRKELKETTTALKQQNSILLSEQARLELTPTLNKYHDNFNETFNQSFALPEKPPSNEEIYVLLSSRKDFSLKFFYDITSEIDEMTTVLYEKHMNHDWRKENYFTPIWERLNKIKTITKDIHQLTLDYIHVAQLRSIEQEWFMKYLTVLEKSLDIGSINEEEKEEMLRIAMDKRALRWGL